MMDYTQQPLPPFVATSDTSYAAAVAKRPTAPAQWEQVYATLYAHGALTADCRPVTSQRAKIPTYNPALRRGWRNGASAGYV
jgi:hypothetical protein